MAKVLASRLKRVIHKIISPNQSAFVAERQIIDSILIANEVVDEYKTKRKQGWIFKLDFEKAYEMVDWESLLEVLRRKGFGDKWASWIKGCISNTSFSIFINGRPRGKFKASRGLRQGDPLASFLFVIVVDVFGSILDLG